MLAGVGYGTYVSIPFKRESVFRDAYIDGLENASDRFQFPSNGKVYSEVMAVKTIVKSKQIVSIPFKRESVFRAKKEKGLHLHALMEFQFPSNGKVYSETWLRHKSGFGEKFQFPSNGKVYSELTNPPMAPLKDQFQFPSNGKVYSETSVNQQSMFHETFQFPSNGKVYSE